jgi:hypothetical protein
MVKRWSVQVYAIEKQPQTLGLVKQDHEVALIEDSLCSEAL